MSERSEEEWKDPYAEAEEEEEQRRQQTSPPPAPAADESSPPPAASLPSKSRIPRHRMTAIPPPRTKQELSPRDDLTQDTVSGLEPPSGVSSQELQAEDNDTVPSSLKSDRVLSPGAYRVSNTGIIPRSLNRTAQQQQQQDAPGIAPNGDQQQQRSSIASIDTEDKASGFMELDQAEAQYSAELVSATAVQDDSPIAEARKDTFWLHLKQNRKTQLLVAAVALLLVGMAVGLGVAFSGSGSSSKEPQENDFFQEVALVDGQASEGEFGSSVALSSDGNRMAVGSPGIADSKLVRSLVQVYEKNSTSWQSIGTIEIGENVTVTSPQVRSPLAIALSQDGNTLAIGSPFQAPGGLVELYNFDSTGSWKRLGQALQGNTTGSLFGSSVALSEDGAIVAIGSSEYTQVYQLNRGNWIPRGSVIPGSGMSVSMSSNGKFLAIGGSTSTEDDVVVRTFEFFSDWNPHGTGIQGNEGTSYLAHLSADGSILCVSNYYIDADGQDTSNESLDVRAFRFTDGNWMPLGDPIHANVTGDKSGYIVSLSDDGQLIAMGDPGTRSKEGAKSGHAHIYQYSQEEGGFVQIGPDIYGANPGDQFGYSVAISGDGRRFASGAPFNRENGPAHGRVQVFEWE